MSKQKKNLYKRGIVLWKSTFEFSFWSLLFFVSSLSDIGSIVRLKPIVSTMYFWLKCWYMLNSLFRRATCFFCSLQCHFIHVYSSRSQKKWYMWVATWVHTLTFALWLICNTLRLCAVIKLLMGIWGGSEFEALSSNQDNLGVNHNLKCYK